MADLKAETAERLIAAGNRAESEGRVLEACETYRAAVQAAPRYAPAHLNLAIGLEASGDVDGALESYDRALELDPQNAYVNYNLGKLLSSRGNDARAEKLLRLALKSKPDFPEARVVLSGLYELRGDLPAAAAELQAAMARRPAQAGALDPRLAKAHIGLGDIHRGGDEIEEAVRCYQGALSIDPDNVEARWSVVMCRLRAVYETDAAAEQDRSAFGRELDELDRWIG